MPENVKCPRCKQFIIWENNPYRPFCSEKCKLIDLGKWAEEKYRVPGEKVSQEETKDQEEEKDK
ncbi:MAG TPA: DNA gyrase inhibitor YacG [Bdellovibrionota bacterium]|nr:DNA gyrase inhibitor YacG [Bdellovibrionota bacterium]